MSYLYVCSMVVKRQDMDAAKNPWGVSTESSSSCSSILYSAAARISNQPIVATNSCLSGFGGICGRINAEHIHTLFFCPCRNFWALIGLTGAMSGGAEERQRSFNAEGAIRVESDGGASKRCIRRWRRKRRGPMRRRRRPNVYGSSGGKGVWPDSGRTDKSELGATTNTLIRSWLNSLQPRTGTLTSGQQGCLFLLWLD